MVISVLSLIRGSDAGAARPADPALELNAYAVAEDIELTLVLQDRGVELALRDAHHHAGAVAGVDVPVAAPETDIRALVASGVRVLAVRDDLTARGLEPGDLVEGVEPIDGSELAGLIVEHDATLVGAS